MNAPEKIVKPYNLTIEERKSAFWKSLMNHWEEKLLAARLALEASEDEKKSAALRGKIKEIKENLALNREPIMVPDENKSPYP